MLPLLEEFTPTRPFIVSPVCWPPRVALVPPRVDPSKLPPLRWRGEFFSARSFAHVNREAVAALRRLGASVLLDSTDTEPEPEVLAWERSRALRAGPSPQETPTVQIEFLAEEVPPAPLAPSVVYVVVWESFVLPAPFAAAIAERRAQVWAASEGSAAACVRAGVSAARVRVLPHGVSREIFSPQASPRELGLSGRFVFLFSGVAHYRKGVDVAVRAFLEEFTPREPVSLVIKDAPASYGWGSNLGRGLAALSAREGPRVMYVVERANSAEMAALYAASDVVLAPSRGEGFNLPVLEAVACGRRVLATETGVAGELARVGGVRLVEGDPVEEVDWCARRSPLAMSSWLCPRVDSLRHLMRACYRDGRGLGSSIRVEPYTWDWVAAEMGAALQNQNSQI